MATQSKSEESVRPTISPEKRYFSIKQANEALPYVAKIVSDIQACYRRAVRLQERLDQYVPADDLQLVQDERELTVERLNDYVEELHEVGVELKDCEIGLVDFPSVHDGREIYLCWKSGEKKIKAWHETDAGFAGRQNLQKLCATCAS